MGNMTLYQRHNSAYSTFDRGVAAPWIRESGTRLINVPIYTLANVTRGLTRDFELLKVDVEGFELQVFLGFDWHVRPKVIVAEVSDLGATHAGELEALITGHGYVLAGRRYLDNVYCDERYPELAERFLSAEDLAKAMQVEQLVHDAKDLSLYKERALDMNSPCGVYLNGRLR
jgi:hypothetical protein